MKRNVFLKAFATGGLASPGVCLIRFDAPLIQRLQTMTTMARDFEMEFVSDRCNSTWRDETWQGKFTLAAPQLFVSTTKCWWSIEVITGSGVASFYSERVSTERLLSAYRDSTDYVMYYTEQAKPTVSG